MRKYQKYNCDNKYKINKLVNVKKIVNIRTANKKFNTIKDITKMFVSCVVSEIFMSGTKMKNLQNQNIQ